MIFILERFLFQLTFVMFYRFTNFKSSDPFLFLFAFHHFELISVHFFKRLRNTYEKLWWKTIDSWFVYIVESVLSGATKCAAVLIRTKSWADCYSTSCFKNSITRLRDFAFKRCVELLLFLRSHFWGRRGQILNFI